MTMVAANPALSREQRRKARHKRGLERFEKRQRFFAAAGKKWYVFALLIAYAVGINVATVFVAIQQFQIEPSRLIVMAVVYYMVCIAPLSLSYIALAENQQWHKEFEKKHPKLESRVFLGVLFAWLVCVVGCGAVSFVLLYNGVI